MEENVIVKELRQMLELAENMDLDPKQIKWYRYLLDVAKPVKCVLAADVLEDYQLDYIKHVIKPKKNECYRNSHLLTNAFPEILYVEGKVDVPFEIDHGFNRVGDKYIDITFEFALGENPREYPYLSIGEYDARMVMELALETGYYGEYYKYLYIKNLR